MDTDPYEEPGQLDRIETQINEVHAQLDSALDLFNDHEKKIEQLQQDYQELATEPRWWFGFPINTAFSVIAIALAVTVFFS